MSRRFCTVMCALLLWTSLSGADDGYRRYTAMTEILRNLERAHPELVQLESIGRTMRGRELWIIRLTNERSDNPEQKSGLFLGGTLEGNHLVGCEIILRTAEMLLSRYGQDSTVTALLDDHTLYLAPRINPDAAEHFFGKVRSEQVKNFVPFDDDHDGLDDEDPPEDLNGDGVITLMRFHSPEGTFMPDASDDRLLKQADPAKGERGIFKIISEGIDNDGDGEINEDGIGGVNINRNFPHRYPYFQADAGIHMASESETRALLDFMMAHRNIGIVVCYSHHDNLIDPPKSQQLKPEAVSAEDRSTGNRFRRDRKPATSILASDLPYFQSMSELYRDATGIMTSKNKKYIQPPGGSFTEWAYFQYGVLSGTTPLWCRPPTVSGADTMKAGGRKSERSEETSIDIEWIRWIEDKRLGEGFAPWQEFDHPDLGRVEIGGFTPYTKTNPPPELLHGLAEKHTDFVIKLSEFLPRLVLKNVIVDQEADQLFRIEATLINAGLLPTALEHAVRARAVKPVLIKLEGEDIELMGGKHLIFLDTLAGSGKGETMQWMVHAKRGAVVTLSITSEKAGSIRRRLNLR